MSYFPQLADGGTAGQRWQTSFVFMNPHLSRAAQVELRLFGDSGGPLPLNLGSGASASTSFILPPLGSRVLRSSGETSLVTGYAIAYSSLPVHSTVLFRTIENGVPRTEISAQPTQPTLIYRSFANPTLGIALVNPEATPAAFVVTAFDQNGTLAAAPASVALGAGAHTSFNLAPLLPGLPANFIGTIDIRASQTGRRLLAWTLNATDGVLSSLPPGTAPWPISHPERVLLAFAKLWDVALSFDGFGTTRPTIRLVSDYRGHKLNAYASASEIFLTAGLSELISDSPSELAFAIAHELGHVYQARTGQRRWLPTAESDADFWGVLLALGAGYDPYGAGGFLGKLSMVAGKSGTNQAQFEDVDDPAPTFSTRASTLLDAMKLDCAATPASCDSYRAIFHPNVPPSLPLELPALPTSEMQQQTK